MDLTDHNYYEQEDLRCCANCAQNDRAVDSIGTEYVLCTVYGDPVADIGYCDLFEF
jgi:hypothetical protein